MSDFQRACALEDVPPDGVLAVDVDGEDVAVVRIRDEVYAIFDECSHAAIALSEGDVDPEACEIECWLHGSRFDLRSGKPTNLPATVPVPVFACKVESGDVLVDVNSPSNTDMES